MNQDTMSLDGKNILSYQRGHMNNFHLLHINYTLYSLLCQLEYQLFIIYSLWYYIYYASEIVWYTDYS